MLSEALSDEVDLIHSPADHLVDSGDIVVVVIPCRLRESYGQNWIAQLFVTLLRDRE